MRVAGARKCKTHTARSPCMRPAEGQSLGQHGPRDPDLPQGQGVTPSLSSSSPSEGLASGAAPPTRSRSPPGKVPPAVSRESLPPWTQGHTSAGTHAAAARARSALRLASYLPRALGLPSVGAQGGLPTWGHSSGQEQARPAQKGPLPKGVGRQSSSVTQRDR